jgi:hypothetical protein
MTLSRDDWRTWQLRWVPHELDCKKTCHKRDGYFYPGSHWTTFRVSEVWPLTVASLAAQTTCDPGKKGNRLASTLLKSRSLAWSSGRTGQTGRVVLLSTAVEGDAFAEA